MLQLCASDTFLEFTSYTKQIDRRTQGDVETRRFARKERYEVKTHVQTRVTEKTLHPEILVTVIFTQKNRSDITSSLAVPIMLHWSTRSHIDHPHAYSRSGGKEVIEVVITCKASAYTGTEMIVPKRREIAIPQRKPNFGLHRVVRFGLFCLLGVRGRPCAE